MAARITMERILRDDDDMSGQSIRKWVIESEGGHVTVRVNHGEGFLLLRPEDIDVFVADLERAQDAALSLAAEAENG